MKRVADTILRGGVEGYCPSRNAGGEGQGSPHYKGSYQATRLLDYIGPRAEPLATHMQIIFIGVIILNRKRKVTCRKRPIEPRIW